MTITKKHLMIAGITGVVILVGWVIYLQIRVHSIAKDTEANGKILCQIIDGLKQTTDCGRTPLKP